MRIALVTESFYPAVDGTTTTLKAVADRLIDRGHDILVVAPGPGLGTYRRNPVARIRPLEKTGRQVREALDLFRPDLVQVASPGRVGREALSHAARVGIPRVVVEQSALTDEDADRWSHRVAERSDVLLVTSRWMLDRVAALGAQPRLWEPGVDTDAFTPALRDTWLHDRWSRRHTRDVPLVIVGYVGGLRRRHDVRRLAELAAIPGIRPIVVGDGPQRDWLQDRLPDAKFLGSLPTGDLTVVLPTFDLLVHPGEHETCCHALREAAASGVPVVAPRSGGAPDVVRHLETGLLYDPRDRRGLVRAVEAVAADQHRALLGRRGRELATRDWRTAVDELLERHLGPLLAHRSHLQ